MKKKILFLIVLLIIIKTDVFALTYGGCDYSSVSRLKSLINNINISYDYHISNNTAYFDITLNNIPNDVYFVDTKTNNSYTYSNTNNGEITLKNYKDVSGGYRFYSALDECYGVSLGTKYYTLPTYNPYYGDKLCKDIPNYSLCQKWTSIGYSYDEFEQKVNEYKNRDNTPEEEPQKIEYNKSFLDNIVDIYVKYYYLFLGGIIVICGIVIFIKNRKDRFNL